MDKIKIITINKQTGLQFSFVIDRESILVVPHCQLILFKSNLEYENIEEEDLIVKAMELISEELLKKILDPVSAKKIISIENLGCINGDSGFKFTGVSGLLDTTCIAISIIKEVEDGKN